VSRVTNNPGEAYRRDLHFRLSLALTAGIFFYGVLLVPANALAVEAESTRPAGLAELSLEELLNIEVTSVSKRPEKLSEAAAAIYVITQDDIRRSGATSIAEALRLAPGVEVARINAHIWAVTARGFNDQFANKLLVLMDGRSVYTPLFAGTFWDVQDTLLEDIERIEVIRGPGATLWGANAVNGVINIITKPARETQGALVSAGGGTEERGFAGIRYGGKLGEDAYFRVYVKYFDRDNSVLTNGMSAADKWDVLRGGFRVDWDASDDNLLTFLGNLYTGDVGTGISLSGGNLLGRWSHRFANGSDMKLQTYYDHTRRKETIEEDRDTFDIDFDHRVPWGSRQEILWGLGYRLSADDIRAGTTAGGTTVSLEPDSRTTHLFTAFVQDEITLIEKRVSLSVGSKFEHNDFTGFEVQPSGRVLWTPHPRHSVWAAVSRAVRTPSRAEDDVRVTQALPAPPFPPDTFTQLRGDRRFEAETLLAYELGYRVQLSDALSFDMATFYNVYERLRSFEPVAPSAPPPAVLAAAALDNKLEGETYGVEVAGHWQVMRWWRLHANYSHLQLQLHKKGGGGGSFIDGTELDPERAEANSPQQQFGLRSAMDLPGKLELDCAVRFVDRLSNLNVPGYVSLDVRLGWRPNKNLEVAVVGQNLLDDQHPEFRPTFLRFDPTEVQRSVYGKVTWRY
jgi:iron complex outermembrane receptor protein